MYGVWRIISHSFPPLVLVAHKISPALFFFVLISRSTSSLLRLPSPLRLSFYPSRCQSNAAQVRRPADSLSSAPHRRGPAPLGLGFRDITLAYERTLEGRPHEASAEISIHRTKSVGGRKRYHVSAPPIRPGQNCRRVRNAERSSPERVWVQTPPPRAPIAHPTLAPRPY